jgi:hypothetical protein
VPSDASRKAGPRARRLNCEQQVICLKAHHRQIGGLLGHKLPIKCFSCNILAPELQIDKLARLRRETRIAAEQIAKEMISTAEPNCPPPPEAEREAILRALDLFRTTLIAKMLPVGQILSQALEPAH